MCVCLDSKYGEKSRLFVMGTVVVMSLAISR
jgi:hypothetical protein